MNFENRSISNNKQRNRIFKFFSYWLLVVCMLISFSSVTYGASKSTLNARAEKAYIKKVNSLKQQKNKPIEERRFDFNWDGINDLLVFYRTFSGGSGFSYDIYTYKSKKVKKLLSFDAYGVESIRIYKKSKGIVVHGAGHGGEWYRYYKKKGSKYKFAGMKGRQTYPVGKWYYSKNQEMTKKQFNKAIKGIQKGKKRIFDLY